MSAPIPTEDRRRGLAAVAVCRQILAPTEGRDPMTDTNPIDQAQALLLQQPNTGVWVARYSDGSGISAHRCEIDAHRAANGTSLDVVFVPWGDDLLREGTPAR